MASPMPPSAVLKVEQGKDWGSWVVVRPGLFEKPLFKGEKDEAVDEARRLLCQDYGGEIRVVGRRGTIDSIVWVLDAPPAGRHLPGSPPVLEIRRNRKMDDWEVFRKGERRPALICDTQAEAVDGARQLLGEDRPGDILIFNETGKVIEEVWVLK